MKWAKSRCGRTQGILFGDSLDDTIPDSHPVRVFDQLLDKIDWNKFEARYTSHRGRPPIQPRIIVAVLLYGLIRGIRSSRALEEALIVRLDFRWLADGLSIDHTTLSEFRRKFKEECKDLFVQLNQLAQQAFGVTFNRLAYDGTRIRANNRRSGSRSVETLEKVAADLPQEDLVTDQELKEEFELMNEEMENADGCEPKLPRDLADADKRAAALAKAAAELKRIKEAGEAVPKRLPLTDPESRITPNKEGGFAPNYTPLATVDADFGMIADSNVIAHTDEAEYLIESVDHVTETYGTKPETVMADPAMCSGPVLVEMEKRGVTFVSPLHDPAVNSAKRPDPTQPVPQDQWGKLPVNEVTVNGAKQKQLDKSAFIYDEQNDCYWCPNGQKLTRSSTTSQIKGKGQRIKETRYKADPSACAECPLKALCLQATGKTNKKPARQITRDEYEAVRQRHKERMATDEAKQQYRRRCAAVERPFAVIKQIFGVRQFLLRGKENVNTEWTWIATAFNVSQMLARPGDLAKLTEAGA